MGLRARIAIVAIATASVGAIGLADAHADVHLRPNPQGALAGKTVVFSPGHGYMPDNGRWRFQRGVVHDLREDIHTNEIFTEYVQRYLLNAGARVESCRERSFQLNEVVVDDGGAGFSQTGTWTTSSNVSGYAGTGYRWAPTRGSATATATFRPSIPESGRYPVYVRFTRGSDRATDARFVVQHTGGETECRVNQQGMGGHWQFIGEFHFDAGTAGAVVLDNTGSDANKVVIADAVRFGAGIGASGRARWEEGAKAFIPFKGFSSTSGEVTIRPRYATALAGGDTSRWRDDFIYVALHSNASGSGSGSSARGLSTFAYSNGRTPGWGSAGARHYTNTPSSLEAESDRFRDTMHHEILSTVRGTFEPSWPDRRTHRMNFGELREARNMPSCLIELGFHDNVDDTGLLSNTDFRHMAARGIYKGIVRYWDPGATIIPLAPDGVRVTNLGYGQLEVSWDIVDDPLEPSASPTGFKVYTSRDGYGFDEGIAVLTTSHVLTGIAAGEKIFVRIAAMNDGGESLPSRIAGARVGEPGTDAMLIVDGFDRPWKHTHDNIQARWVGDEVVRHLDALDQARSGPAIDFAQNETIGRRSVDLGQYALVDWQLGREGSITKTFDPDEQLLVEDYLRASGTILVSGSELAWELDGLDRGRRFLREVLGARYVSDEAGTRVANATPGGPLAGLGTVLLDDGTGGSYRASSPDVIAAEGPGSVAALSWETSGAPVAAVATPATAFVVAFPIEAIVDEAVRRDLVARAIDILLPPTTPGGGGGGTAPGGGAGGSTGGTPGNGSGGTTGGGSTTPTTPKPGAFGGGGGGGGGGCVAASPDAPAAPEAVVPLILVLLLLVVARRRR